MKKIDIHNRERTNRTLKKRLENADICSENKYLIKKFIKYKIEESEISVLRQNKYFSTLRIIAEKFKECYKDKLFKESTKEDFNSLLKYIFSIKIRHGGSDKKPTLKPMSPATREDYAIQLKTFLTWMDENNYPVKGEWIKVPRREKPKRLRPDELLTWEDIVKLSRAAMNTRDRALVQVLFESGGRIGEVLTMFLCDVEVRHDGSALILHLRESKTDIRGLCIIKSAPALVEWIEKHPIKDNPDAPLFCTLDKNNNSVEYNSINKVLRDLRARCPDMKNKKVNPHHFRKSAASYFSHVGLTEFEVKKRFGWVMSSKMFDIYVHPDENRINDKLMEMNGLIEKTPEQKQKEDEKSNPWKCGWCAHKNPAGTDFCSTCKRAKKFNKEGYKENLNPDETKLIQELKAYIDEQILSALNNQTKNQI